MYKLIDRFEFAIFVAAICMISAGILGLYLKLFNMAPPLPVVVMHFPITLAMILTIIVRLRESVFGLLSLLPYVMLSFLAVASFKWSLKPSFTFVEAVTALIYVIYLGTMCWRYSWKQLIEGMWLAMFGMVLLSLFLYVAVPSIGRMSEIYTGVISGVWLEKNMTGQAGTFGALLALARLAIDPKTFKSSLISFFLFTLILILSSSKTSLVAYIIGVAVFGWVFMMRRNLPTAMVTLWSSIVVGGLAVSWVRGNMGEVLGLLGKSSTFTGRSEIWQAVEISLASRPLLGHGYSGYWDEIVYGKTLAFVYEDLQFLPRHSHNSLIDMKLNLGLVGAALMVGSIAFYMVVTFMKTRKSHGAYFAIPFMAAAIIIGMFESILAYPSNFGGAVMVLVAAKMARPVLLSERQAGFWNTMNSFRTQGQGPQKRKAYTTQTPMGQWSYGRSEAGYIDRRNSAPAQFIDRRRSGGPMTAAKIQGRLLARRKGERSA